MTLTDIIKKEFRKIAITGTLFLALAMGGIGCGKRYEFQNYQTHPVDQVFRDHNGYRVYFTNEENVMQEIKYFGSCGYSDWATKNAPEHMPDKDKQKFKYPHIPVVIIKDLELGERGYAKVIRYSAVNGALGGGVDNANVVEIHIPEDQGISPGTETWGGKYKKSSNMGEIK